MVENLCEDYQSRIKIMQSDRTYIWLRFFLEKNRFLHFFPKIETFSRANDTNKVKGGKKSSYETK